MDAYVTAHRLAYGTEMMTKEMRLAIMRQPCYKPDLDLVVEAPQKSLAAFCVGSNYEEENIEEGFHEGEISIVGVHPDYRRCGLRKAAVWPV